MAERTTRIMLDLHPGMMMEVLSADNRLSFLGRVIAYEDDKLTVEDARGQEMLPAIYNHEVKMRLFQNGNSHVLTGKVSGCTKAFWRIDRLKELSAAEKREAFRQAISTFAVVERLDHTNQNRGSARCKVLDISMGGLLFQSRELYQLKDRLQISDVRVSEEERPFRFKGRVQRVKVLTAGEAQFGCRFEPLEPREEDRLLRAIFSAQRRELKKRRL